MSLNTAHSINGVILNASEFVLGYVKCLPITYFHNQRIMFKKAAPHAVFLTSHRLVFFSLNVWEDWQSLSAPYLAITNVEPVYGNEEGNTYVKGVVHAQPEGNFTGCITFRALFKNEDADGAKVFSEFLRRAVMTVKKGNITDPVELPPYHHATAWHVASPAATQPPSCVAGSWIPKHDIFSDIPLNIFSTSHPCEYVGLTMADLLPPPTRAAAHPWDKDAFLKPLSPPPEEVRRTRFTQLQGKPSTEPVIIGSSEEDAALMGLRPQRRALTGSDTILGYYVPVHEFGPDNTPAHCMDWIPGVNAPDPFEKDNDDENKDGKKKPHLND